MNKQFLIMLLLSCLASVLAAENTNSVNKLNKAGDIKAIVNAVEEIGEILEHNGIVINEEAVQTAVINAMIQAIDPHAAILTGEQADRQTEENLGVFYGIGLKIELKDKKPQILEIIKGTPSADSELQVNDTIKKIDGQNTKGLTLEQVVNLLRGKQDEPVELQVAGKGENAQPRSITIIRKAIEMPKTGIIEQWPHQIGYIKVNGLYQESGGQIVTQLRNWSNTNYFGVILDLRAANGIDLTSVEKIAGLFANQGTPLFCVRNGNNNVLSSYHVKNGNNFAMPVMILVDKETSGSSEALAAVLKHRKGVMLIGQPTSGDNHLREVIPLKNGMVLYIATRHINLENGSSYDNKGVMPDMIVSESKAPKDIEQVEDENHLPFFSTVSEQEKQAHALAARVSADPALRRALDILLGIQALDIHVH